MRLTFDSKHGPLSYPCDTFEDWQANVRAIALALEALPDRGGNPDDFHAVQAARNGS